MTDLLHRLASRATGRRRLPATVPLLPPRPAAERPSREPLGSGEDATPEEVGDVAALSWDGEASGRGTWTGLRRADGLPVSVPPAVLYDSPPVVHSALGTPPPPAPVADAVRREAPTGDERFVEKGGAVPQRRPLAPPVSAPPTTTVTPSAAAPAMLPSSADGGTSPAPHGGPEPSERRPRRRPVAPDQDPTRPTRREEARGVPVARPVVVPAPSPPTVVPRPVAPPSVVATTEPAPAVTITIGRVEIRAVPPAAHAPAPPEPDGVSRGGSGASVGSLSLGDFLRGTGDAR
ncbi:hypothetical protein ACFUJR_05825 [Streptomyces sp. NPDC057271]|uniref:hypothetical protein n=1 Tax=unclassified Streptomyces TaxID=2593676 RepID=UPI0036269522